MQRRGPSPETAFSSPRGSKRLQPNPYDERCLCASDEHEQGARALRQGPWVYGKDLEVVVSTTFADEWGPPVEVPSKPKAVRLVGRGVRAPKSGASARFGHSRWGEAEV
jgi:hypothetical protein